MVASSKDEHDRKRKRVNTGSASIDDDGIEAEMELFDKLPENQKMSGMFEKLIRIEQQQQHMCHQFYARVFLFNSFNKK